MVRHGARVRHRSLAANECNTAGAFPPFGPVTGHPSAHNSSGFHRLRTPPPSPPRAFTGGAFLFFSTSSSHLLGFCGFSRWVAWVCLSVCRVDFFLFFFFFKYQSQPTQFVRDFSPPSSLFGSLCARIILLLIVNSECASQPIHREKEKKKRNSKTESRQQTLI